MAYNDRKIVQLLLDQVATVTERYPGYREELSSLLADILNLEREHAISRTNIVKKMGDRVNAVGMLLYRLRPEDGEMTEEAER